MRVLRCPQPIFRPLPPRGIALVSILLLIAMLSALIMLSMRSANMKQWMAGRERDKMNLVLLARSATEIIHMRLTQRMNPEMFDADGNAKSMDDLRTMVQVTEETGDLDYCPGSGECYHGYRFQNGKDVNKKLALYIRDFIKEAEVTVANPNGVGIFEPCLYDEDPAKSCASDESHQWRVHYKGLDLNSSFPNTHADLATSNETPIPPHLNFDFRNDGENDVAYRLLVEIEAFDGKSSERSVVQADYLIVSPYPSLDAVYSSSANVLSPMNFHSGYVKGVLGHFPRASRLPSEEEHILDFGQRGPIHPSCKTYGVLGRLINGHGSPCSSLIMSGQRKAYLEQSGQYMNMRVQGLVSNMGISWKGFWSAGGGIEIDDGNPRTGDPDNALYSGALPEDALLFKDPGTFEMPDDLIMGRDAQGAVSDYNFLTDLATMRNENTLSKITSTGNCIYASDGSNDGGLSSAINALPDGKSDHSVVLAPQAGCEIQIDGDYLIEGDLVIAGDGDGVFSSPTGGLNSSLVVTGNIYILNNVNVKNGPGGAAEAQDAQWASYRDDTFNPTGAAEFDQLSLVAAGHTVIGNLANSQNFAHIMTNANSELPYYQMDLNGNGQSDYLVPDSYRPGGPARDPNDPFQVRRHTCQDQLAAGLVTHCETSAFGLLPEGSDPVTSLYKFAFLQDLTDEAGGFGYIRDPGDPANHVDSSNSSLDTPATASRPLTINDPVYQSSLPVGASSGDPKSNLFENGWISTDKFRKFAGALLVEGDQFRQHDSLHPDYVNRAHFIAAKLFAGQTIVGLASFDDKYNLPNVDTPNPDYPMSSQYNFGPWDGADPLWPQPNSLWGARLTKRVHKESRYPNRCTSLPPHRVVNTNPNGPDDVPYTNIDPFGDGRGISRGIDVFGGLYAKYVNILSTNGLCLYNDNRPANPGHEQIVVIQGSAYQEDAN